MTGRPPAAQARGLQDAAAMLQPLRRLAVSADRPPALVVVVDTEEEFDWSLPFDRASTSVRAMRAVDRFQEVCDAAGVRPTYAVDYPVAAQDEGAAPLRRILQDGRARLAAHLHPWVTPPHEEEVCAFHSYAGNLPRELEAAKIETLTRTLVEGFGIRPRAYKAGRYGIGPNTPEILLGAGYAIDLSCNPPFDFRADGGPDFRTFSPEPFRFGPGGALLGVPTSGAFVGWLRAFGPRLHGAASRGLLRVLRASAVLARTRALDRLRLSPEGYTFAEMRRLARDLISRGVRLLSMSLHSPSMEPGCTPYVRTRDDLQRLLGCCRDFFRFAQEELGAVPATPEELEEIL